LQNKVKQLRVKTGEVSSVMYNEEKFKIDWRTIVVHDDNNIKGFFGPARFLSNFPDAICEFEGMIFRSSELAYQAAKVAPAKRYLFLPVTSAKSKTLWKQIGTVYSPAEWDLIKESVMQRVVFSKFEMNKDLRAQLIETGDKYLEEKNFWRDNFWGVDYKIGGQNKLGSILMATRAYWKNYEKY